MAKHKTVEYSHYTNPKEIPTWGHPAGWDIKVSEDQHQRAIALMDRIVAALRKRGATVSVETVQDFITRKESKVTRVREGDGVTWMQLREPSRRTAYTGSWLRALIKYEYRHSGILVFSSGGRQVVDAKRTRIEDRLDGLVEGILAAVRCNAEETKRRAIETKREAAAEKRREEARLIARAERRMPPYVVLYHEMYPDLYERIFQKKRARLRKLDQRRSEYGDYDDAGSIEQELSAIEQHVAALRSSIAQLRYAIRYCP